MLPLPVLRHAHHAIEAIEYALALHADDSFFSPDAPPPGLSDCDFPDGVDEPLEIVRLTQGEERARWFEYQDDLECILGVLEHCLNQELLAREMTLWDLAGVEEDDDASE